jgi:urease accessory protein
MIPVEPALMNAAQWRAELSLKFSARGTATILSDCRHRGPLRVQKALYPEGEAVCQAIVLHPPSGIAGGDQLRIAATVGPAAHAQLTTPGAGKWYRSAGAEASQTLDFTVAENATLEWLPQETIVFDGADASIDTRVTLEAGATYVGWDFICLGRPAAGERFETGTLRQRIEIVRDGRPIWFERVRLPGGSALQGAPYALAGQPTWGTMIYAGPMAEDAAERVREAVGSQGDGVFTVSQLEHAVVCRYLGPRVSEGKALFVRAWDALRTSCQGKAANAPRIWAT